MMDDALPYLVSLFLFAVLAMFAIGLKRGKRIEKTNNDIETNQKRQIELHERQVAALERIANSLENRG